MHDFFTSSTARDGRRVTVLFIGRLQLYAATPDMPRSVKPQVRHLTYLVFCLIAENHDKARYNARTYIANLAKSLDPTSLAPEISHNYIL